MAKKYFLDNRFLVTGDKSHISLDNYTSLNKIITSVVGSGGGSGDNFANADLIFTGNRIHSGNGQTLELRDMSSVDFNVQEFNSLTEVFDMKNASSDFQVFNGLDPLFGIPCVAFRSEQDTNNYALNYVKDLGGFPGLGMLRVRDGGGASAQSDTIAIDDDTIVIEQVILDTGVTYQNTLRHDKETLVLEHQDDIGAVQVIAALDISRSSYHFRNNNDTGFKFPIVAPTDEYQALVGDTTGSCTWEYTYPGDSAAVEKLPGKHFGLDHYKVTVIITAGGGIGDIMYIYPVGAEVYKIEGKEDVSGGGRFLPFNDGAEYIQFTDNGTAVLCFTNIPPVDVKLTIYYAI